MPEILLTGHVACGVYAYLMLREQYRNEWGEGDASFFLAYCLIAGWIALAVVLVLTRVKQ